MTEAKTSLGSYLLTKRLTRGGDNLTQYMNQYSISDVLSESYYRDLEAGRKLIRLQSAEALCEKLDLDRKSFYYYLLKDLVPEDVFEQLVSQSAIETFKSASERSSKLEQYNKDMAKSLINSLSDDITDLSGHAIDNLKKDDALLSVLHFIYNRKSCSFSDIDYVYQNCGGIGSVAYRLVDLLGLKVVRVDLQNKTVSRWSPTIRVPTDENGRIFKNGFTEKEVTKSLQKQRTRTFDEKSGTLQYSVIVPLEDQSVRRLEIDGFSRFISLVQSSDCTLEDKKARPFFVAVMISSRDEYNVNQRESEV